MLHHLFWSSDSLAQIVIVFNVILFTAWFVILFASWVWLSKERAWARRLEFPQLLTSSYNSCHEESDGSLTEEEAEKLFLSYLKRVDVPFDSIAATHLRTIYDAGRIQSRLEPADLLRATASRLFKNIGALRTVLGVFIVIGLFGTLSGLTKALAPLSDMSFGPGGQVEIASDLSGLLKELQSAFAPSVVGVNLTAIGVLLFALFNALAVAPVRSLFDTLTLTDWFPKLYPTRSQHLIQTLIAAEQQSHKNIEVAREVAEFASRLENEMNTFGPRLNRAAETLSLFDQTLEKVVIAANTFALSTHELGAFRQELAESYAASNQHSERIESLLHRMEGTIGTLSDSVRVLRVFEDSYVTTLQGETRELMASMREALSHFGEQQEALVTAIAAPVSERLEGISERLEGVTGALGTLNQETGKSLERVDTSLHEGLAGVKTGLQKVGDPLSDASQAIQGMANTFASTMQRLIQDVRSDFNRQNQETATSREEIAAMGKALSDIARQLERSNTRQDNMIASLQKLANRAERVSRFRAVVDRMQSWRSNGKVS